MSIKNLGLPIFIGLTLLGCDKQPEVNATCSAPETQAAISKNLLADVEKQLGDVKDDDANFMYDQAKIRASLALPQIILEAVRTVKEDPNSSKKFCTASLKMTIPTAMLTEVNQAGELFTEVKLNRAIPYSLVKIGNYARELNIDNSVNVFTKKDLQYNVQPTDDKKEIFVEMESSTATSLLYRITEMALLKPMLEVKKSEQATQASEQKAQEKKEQQEIENLKKEAQQTNLEIEKKRLEAEKTQAQENLKNAGSKAKDDGSKTRIAFSEKLGVDVYSKGAKWCNQSINLIVKLDDFSPLINATEMEGFIPKLKAPIENECPRAAIAMISVVDSKNEPVGKYKSYKSNDWFPEIAE